MRMGGEQRTVMWVPVVVSRVRSSPAHGSSQLLQCPELWGSWGWCLGLGGLSSPRLWVLQPLLTSTGLRGGGFVDCRFCFTVSWGSQCFQLSHRRHFYFIFLVNLNISLLAGLTRLALICLCCIAILSLQSRRGKSPQALNWWSLSL